MRIITHPKELHPAPARVCIAIGFFDGLHLGHQQIIRQTLADARHHQDISLVITFDRHPNTVVAPSRVPPLIYSIRKKLQTIQSLGIHSLWLIHFDKTFSRRTGDSFIRQLHADLGPIRSICVGENFVFGHKRTGNVRLLRQLGSELDFSVHGVASVSLDNKTVSSTRIRQSIAAGHLDAASQMLGRPYSISGPVIRGDQLGRQLGFPTANLDPSGLVLPPPGVYAALATLPGATHKAVLNIGHRPTISTPHPKLRVEAHLLQLSKDIYGQELELVLLQKLRDEQKFNSLHSLRSQIAADLAHAQTLF